MKTESRLEQLIPSGLLEQVEALAAMEHRSAVDMLREAVEGYLLEKRTQAANSAPPARHMAQEAAARILERRKRHLLPEGESIRDLMTHGRA